MSLTNPSSHVVLTHYHAVRVWVLQATMRQTIIMSGKAAPWLWERGQGRLGFRIARFRALFQGHESIPAYMADAHLLQ